MTSQGQSRSRNLPRKASCFTQWERPTSRESLQQTGSRNRKPIKHIFGRIPAYPISPFGTIANLGPISSTVKDSGVIMNAIAPGLVDLPGRYYTSMKTKNPQMLEKFYDEHLPIRRMLKPNEIADLICYLCSHDVSYMAGAIIPIDGGGS